MCLSLSAPEPFHPSSALLPPPGPPGPLAPVCDRGAPPSLGFELRAVTGPEKKKNCGGDPPKKILCRAVVLVLLVYNCPSERSRLGAGCLDRTGVNEERTECR